MYNEGEGQRTMKIAGQS